MDDNMCRRQGRIKQLDKTKSKCCKTYLSETQHLPAECLRNHSTGIRDSYRNTGQKSGTEVTR